MTHPAAYLPVNIGERTRFEAHGQSFLIGYHSRNTYWLSTDPPGERRRWGTRQQITEDIAYVFENGALPPQSGQMWADGARYDPGRGLVDPDFDATVIEAANKIADANRSQYRSREMFIGGFTQALAPLVPYVRPRTDSEWEDFEAGNRAAAHYYPAHHLGEAHRYAVPPEPPRHFVAPRGKTPEIIFVRVSQVERVRQSGRYEWHDGYSENGNTYPWLTKREAQQDARRRGAKAVFVEPEYGGAAEPHVVADFDTLDDLIVHATQLGATHVLVAGAHTKLYFPRGGQYPYEEARVWRENRYWHAEGPGARRGVSHLPQDAAPLEGYIGWQRRTAEPRRTITRRRR